MPSTPAVTSPLHVRGFFIDYFGASGNIYLTLLLAQVQLHQAMKYDPGLFIARCTPGFLFMRPVVQTGQGARRTNRRHVAHPVP